MGEEEKQWLEKELGTRLPITEEERKRLEQEPVKSSELPIPNWIKNSRTYKLLAHPLTSIIIGGLLFLSSLIGIVLVFMTQAYTYMAGALGSNSFWMVIGLYWLINGMYRLRKKNTISG